MPKLSHSLEDYLEAIWIIGSSRRVVRVKDIMNFLGYRVSSVHHALKVLANKGLVIHERYGYVELTPEGARLAEEIYKRHRTLTKFFSEILGVDKNTASKDACNVEHYLSEATFNRLLKFVKFIECRREDLLKDWFRSVKSQERDAQENWENVKEPEQKNEDGCTSF